MPIEVGWNPNEHADKAGLMVETAIGGQYFKYKPKETAAVVIGPALFIILIVLPIFILLG